MSDAAPAPVPVVDAAGKLWEVPPESVPLAIERGGRVVTPEEAAKLTPTTARSVTETAGAAGLGALETITSGASTAALGELGVATGGQAKRAEYEQDIRAAEKAHPVAHILGEALPLALVPEGAPEAAPLIAGEGLAARAASFAVPKFVRGVAEAAHLEGSQGVSEDTLNHDLTAQSYFAHAATPEVLLGGVLNVGIGAGFAGAKKLVGSAAGRILGLEGETAAADARAANDIIAKAQKSGFTSDEASKAYAGMQDLAQQAAADAPRRGLFDSIADHYAKRFSAGSKDVEAALKRSYLESVDRFAGADRTLDRSTREAVTHSDELLKGLGRMNELQFRLKDGAVAKLVDAAKRTQQIDAAIGARRELGAMLEEALPKIDVKGGELKKIGDVLKKLDGQIKVAADVGEGASEAASSKAAAGLYIALDDTKRVLGRFAKFGVEGKEGTAALADDAYHRILRPLLEDEGIWGERLAKMQTETNRTFSEGFAATRRFQSLVGQVLETPGGKRLYSTEFGRMRSVLDELEHATGTDDLTGLRAEVVQRVVDNVRSRVKSMVETMDLAPGEVAQLKKTAEAATRLESVVKRAQGEQAEFRTLKELKARELDGGVHGIVKSITGVVMNPAKTMHLLGSLKKVEDVVRKTISSDAKAAVSGERIVSTLKPIGATERRIATKAMQDVQQLARDPRMLAGRLDTFVGNVGDVAPKVASSLSATAVRLVNYLATKVPPPLPSRFLDPEPRWADSDAEDFHKLLAIGMQPLTTFERMQKNQLHEEQRDLMEKVFPDLFNEMKAALLNEYKQAALDGKLGKLSYQDKQAMSVMLGVPLDETQTDEFAAAMQQIAMNDPNAQGAIGAQAQGGGRPKTIKIDMSGLKTPAQKMGETAP